MPKGSPELTEKRRNEILDACERAYRARGFYGVNIKEISAETSFTRPAIYNYFATKGEILLGLLGREYEGWCARLEALVPLAPGMTREALARAMAATLEDREVLLRILNKDLFEIEEDSRVERLARFKGLYLRAVTALSDILRAWRPGLGEGDCEDFCNSFCALLFGVSPFAFHTEKQKAAMRMAGVPLREPAVCELVRKSLARLLPGE